MHTPKTTKTFDPHIAFFSLPIVYWTIGIGLFSIVTTCLFIFYFDWRELNLSAEGFNEFLRMIKFPIWLLGFFAALLALFATNHRSEQNKAAMEIAAAQNRFSNYYKHIEEYKNYTDSHFEKYSEESRPKIKIKRLHEVLYKNAKTNGIVFSSEIEIKIFNEVFRFITSLEKANLGDKEKIEQLILNIDDCIASLNSILSDSITFISRTNDVNYFTDTRTIKIPDARLRNFLKDSLLKIEIINEALSFEENFNSPLLESLIYRINHTLNFVPEISLASRKNIDWHPKNGAERDSEIAAAHQKISELSSILTGIKERYPAYRT